MTKRKRKTCSYFPYCQGVVCDSEASCKFRRLLPDDQPSSNGGAVIVFVFASVLIVICIAGALL